MAKVKKRAKRHKSLIEGKTFFGRAAYKSQEDFHKAVLRYFDLLKKKDAPNKSGLCLHLDISRETLNTYKKKYPDTISLANERIKNWWINRLSKSSPIGAIFYLKNLDPLEFKDRTPGDADNPFVADMRITGMTIKKE